MPTVTSHLLLPEGRALAYASHGPASGAPVLYFHGVPASKHNWYLNHDPELLEELGLRVFAIDRPGIGGSTFQVGRSLNHWLQDVESFVDQLGIGRFAVMGYSCGSPYALACALHFRERVAHTAVVSGMVDITHPDLALLPAQQNLQVLQMAVTRPWASRLLYGVMGLSARLMPDMMIGQALGSMPVADREVITKPEVRHAFLAMLHETFAQGPRGAQVDSSIVAASWGLDVERIRGRVRLWHGDADMNVSLAMGQHLAGRLPNSELTVVRGEGHLSLVHRYIREILSELRSEI